MNILEDLEKSKETGKNNPNNNFSSARVNTGISLWFTRETGIPQYFCFLTDLSKCLQIRTHKFTSDGNTLCAKSILLGGDSSTNCKYCKEPDNFDKSKYNKSRNSIVVLAYIFDNVGLKDDILDPEDPTKVLRTVPRNPIKAMEIYRGQEDVNIDLIKDLHKEGVLLTELFQISKPPKEAKKATVPELASRNAVKNKFKHLREGLVVPQHIAQEYNEMSAERVKGLLLNCYVSGKFNLDWDMLKKHAIKPEPVKKEEDPNTDEIE